MVSERQEVIGDDKAAPEKRTEMWVIHTETYILLIDGRQMESHQTSPFLRLSPELRNKVYEYVFGSLEFRFTFN